MRLFFGTRGISIRSFVRPPVGLSVRWSVVIESKSRNTSVLNTYCVCMCGGGEEVELLTGVGCPCPPVCGGSTNRLERLKPRAPRPKGASHEYISALKI